VQVALARSCSLYSILYMCFIQTDTYLLLYVHMSSKYQPPLDKGELLKIQEKFASFIMDQVIGSNGDHHYQNPRFSAR